MVTWRRLGDPSAMRGGHGGPANPPRALPLWRQHGPAAVGESADVDRAGSVLRHGLGHWLGGGTPSPRHGPVRFRTLLLGATFLATPVAVAGSLVGGLFGPPGVLLYGPDPVSPPDGDSQTDWGRVDPAWLLSFRKQSTNNSRRCRTSHQVDRPPGVGPAQFRLGAGSRAAQLEGQGGGPCRGLRQSPGGFGAPGGQRLLRQRGELLERPNAHLYETGRMRRTHLRGHPNILKRLLVHVGGFNLGVLMRQLTGVGTPRSLQGRAAAIRTALTGLLVALWERIRPSWTPMLQDPRVSLDNGIATHQHDHAILELQISPSATGC